MSNTPAKRNSSVEQKRPTVVSTVTAKAVMTAQSFEGPLPTPAMLREYDEISPGLANKIFDMAKAEQDHRHRLDFERQGADDRQRVRISCHYALGQISGLLIGLSGILGGAYLVHEGKDLTGFGVFLTSVATLVGVYIFQRKTAKAKNSKPRPDGSKTPSVDGES